MTVPPSVLQQVQSFPERPGVYLMKDASGKIIYVGKATRLKDRVRSYFGSPAGLTVKTQRLVSHVADLEYIVTDSETEALILECNLIKTHRPRYNVRLKDDKSYPYLKIDLSDAWPQVLITRRIENDGARYFGPYTSSWSVRQTLALVKKLFPYRSCNKLITGTDPRPCLDYHINRCLGPCIGAVSQDEYMEVIQEVIFFLEGKQDIVLKELRRQMEQAAEDLEFERAAHLRDQVQAVERVMERQKVISPEGGDQDVIGFAIHGGECCVQVFLVRSGKLFGREHFILEGTQDELPSAIMTSFVEQFYASAPLIPDTILLQHPVEDPDVIAEWLRERRGRRVSLQVPQRGEKKRLMDMVVDNARETLQQVHVKWLADTGKTAAALTELQDALDLPRMPRRIECYDISNISGTAAVGSMVVFEDGRPKNSDYRRFRIKTVSGIDDYGMMQEMLRRRFKRLAEDAAGGSPQSAAGGESEDTSDNAFDAAQGKREEADVTASPAKAGQPRAAVLPAQDNWLPDDGEDTAEDQPQSKWRRLPDLVVIDGGKGHLGAAMEVMRSLGLHTIPTCALAKQQEEVFLPYAAESIMLPRGSQGLYLLQRVRDEAHRFAITYHRKIRSKQAVASGLDEVPGIGPRRRKALIQKFGSVRALRDAPMDEITAVPGITRKLAETIRERA